MEDRAKAGGWAAEIAAALDWWRDAGVDGDFSDQAANWLAAPDVPGQRPRDGGDAVQRDHPADRGPRLRGGAEIALPPKPAIDPESWPQDLAGFTAWWLNEPALDDGRVSGRVPPRGAAGAEIMVIVPDPERDDRETLLSGPQGRLLDAMLAAMGIATDAVYLASVLPRHTPMADWAMLAEKGFGAVLCDHVKLVAPRRLIALGSNILPLLDNDPAHNPAVLRRFNQQGLSLPLLAGKSLSALLERPRWKAGLWQGWLDWSEGPAAQG